MGVPLPALCGRVYSLEVVSRGCVRGRAYGCVWAARAYAWCVCGRARVWAKNDSSVVWFVNLGVSWLNFRELSVVDSGFVF